MIPTPARALVGGWVTAGKAFVGQYVEIFYAIIAIAVLIAAGWSVWRVMSWKAGYEERDQAVAALKAEHAQQDQKRAEAAMEIERAYNAKLNEASRGYQAALARLRDRPVPDARPVRLCVDAPRVPRTAAAAGGPGSTAAPGGVVHGATEPDSGVRPGPDIGPALQRLAGRADEVTEQARGLQAAGR